MATGVFDATELNTGRNLKDSVTQVIENIAPTEVPFQSNIGRGKASNPAHEFLTDTLAAAVGTNKWVDGAAYTAATDGGGVAATRLGNHCQILRKDISISRRAQNAMKHGRSDEIAYQVAKKGKEIKRDLEVSLTGNYPAIASADNTAPQLAGLGAWMRTNTVRLDTGTAGEDPAAYTSGFPLAGAVDCSNVTALTQANLLAVVLACYQQGSNFDMLMVGPEVKQRISGYLLTDANAVRASPTQDFGSSAKKAAEVIGAVDIYRTDFGVLAITPNRFQRERDVFVLESSKWSLDYFDTYRVIPLAKRGDSEERTLLVDVTLRAKEEKANGIVADVDSTAAMVD